MGDQIFGFLNKLKVLLLTGYLIYSWNYTGKVREERLDIIHELAKDHVIDLTFHHDVMFTNTSYNSTMTDDYFASHFNQSSNVTR